MKNMVLAALMLVLCSNCAATAAQVLGIGDVAKEPCSVASHGRSDKASITTFLNKIAGSEGEFWALKPDEIQAFRWVDLADDGRCELVTTYSGPAVSVLEIYWQDRAQVLPGEANLNEVASGLYGNGKKEIIKFAIRDLNGDGKKEIIMDSYLDPAGGRGGNPTPVWPQVYQLKDEKYVPATPDFPGIYGFYQSEILPKLNAEIDTRRRKWPPDSVENGVAVLEMQRDKILRFLGIDPQAGLQQARQWARSDDPEMIKNAWCVLRDIPGHQADANAADQAWKQTLLRHGFHPSIGGPMTKPAH